MINSRDQVKLVDFGLAKVHQNEASVSSRLSTSSQTEYGKIIGTLPYMSPEQVLGKNVDRRTDYFSLGTVLYELSTQKLPFQGDSAVELADAIIHQPPSAFDLNRKSPELSKIISKMLAKQPDARYQSADEILTDLRKLDETSSASFKATIRKPSVAISILLVLAVLFGAIFWMFHRNSKIRWAREEALPEITRLVDDGKYPQALVLGLQAEKFIPNDPILKTLWTSMSVNISIKTDPPGADVFLQPYESTGENWKKIGATPLNNLRIPKGYHRCKISKNGFRTILVVLPRGYYQRQLSVSYSLGEIDKAPAEMVFVPGLKSDPYSMVPSGGAETKTIPQDYWMDQFEVSNKEFKKFVESGGYRNQKYWKVPFVKDGHELSFDEAIKYFHDTTGRPGPLQWEVGSYARGEDDYPVTGVSWYEAAAYAEFVGKNLPTIHHWYHAAGAGMNEKILAISNFNGRGLRAANDQKSLSLYGTFNMAGNVKEWCWNETAGGKRFILGGSYTEPVYLFMETDQRSPFNREKTFGFRCVKYLSNPDTSFVQRYDPPMRDYTKEKPVDDSVFAVLKTFYSYDKKALNSKLESTEIESYVKTEKVSYDAAYGNERMVTYVYTPVNQQPPYQAVVYFPGAGAQRFSSIENMQGGYADYLDFLVRSGRAAIFPIYKGTFERGGGSGTDSLSRDQLREWKIQIIKDIFRTVDYLESRNDIDKNKLAYYGSSWGARLGSFVGALEPRFQTMILMHGGLPKQPRTPETDEINFVTHVKMPVLMINGKYDHVFPYETSQKPMFQLLGTPEKDKIQLIFEGGHTTPRQDVIKAVLDWLDRYLGPVQT
jgi:dienelactone hydrolase